MRWKISINYLWNITVYCVPELIIRKVTPSLKGVKRLVIQSVLENTDIYGDPQCDFGALSFTRHSGHRFWMITSKFDHQIFGGTL